MALQLTTGSGEAVLSGTKILSPTERNSSGHKHPDYAAHVPLRELMRRRDTKCHCSATDANARQLGQGAPIRRVEVSQALGCGEKGLALPG